jgi:glycosyltransferase involved in cell wall biosynthesis
MASELVCIVSDIPANREVVAHGKNGLLFPPGNHDMLARLLADSMLDQQFCRSIASKALLDVRDRFDWTVVVRKIEEAYAFSRCREVIGT